MIVALQPSCQDIMSANHRYIKEWLLYQTWHIMFTLNCLLATFHIRRWTGWCWRYYKLTKVPNDRAQFESHQWHLGTFSSHFHDNRNRAGLLQPYLWQKKQVFRRGPRDIYSHLWSDHNKYFKLNHDVFLTLTKCFLCWNLTGALAERCDEREIEN